MIFLNMAHCVHSLSISGVDTGSEMLGLEEDMSQIHKENSRIESKKDPSQMLT